MNARYRILIVDDSPVARAELKQLIGGITRGTFDVLEAGDGVQALKLLTGGGAPVDLVVTDMAMPKLDGLQLIRQLRSQERFADLPVLALTALDEEQRKIEVFKAGATDYVVKPFLGQELEARIMGHIERKRAYERIVEQERTLAESMEQARLTQASLLPSEPPRFPGVSLAVKYVPVESLGGDYYDFFSLPADRLGVLIADVSGHGLSAALITFLLAGIFRQSAAHLHEPDTLLGRVSSVLAPTIPKGRFATAFFATYDPADRTLAYSSAGHPPAVLIRPGTQEVRQLGVEGTPLALGSPAAAVHQRASTTLAPGDKVLFHSDAVLEVEDSQERALGFARLKRFLAEHLDESGDSLLESIFALGLAHSGGPGYADDVTMILMEIT